MDLNFFVKWFTDLKNDGVSKAEVLDVLEFDSDVYPDLALMKEAREIVYGRDNDDASHEAFEKWLDENIDDLLAAFDEHMRELGSSHIKYSLSDKAFEAYAYDRYEEAMQRLMQRLEVARE